MEITIATWNIGGGKPLREGLVELTYKDTDYLEEDAEYFASELKKLHPDIICLQETHLGEERSLAKEIGKLTGEYDVAEVGCSPSHIDSQYMLGNAVLFKHKPEKVEFHAFPYPEFSLARNDGVETVRHDKGVQVLRFPFGILANLHMQPLGFLGVPYNTSNGMSYAKKVEEELEKHLANPLILCGDFNYIKSEELYVDLLNKFSLKSVLPNGPTRPDGKMTDYIFISSEFDVIDSGVIETKADHYLCWTKVRV